MPTKYNKHPCSEMEQRFSYFTANGACAQCDRDGKYLKIVEIFQIAFLICSSLNLETKKAKKKIHVKSSINTKRRTVRLGLSTDISFCRHGFNNFSTLSVQIKIAHFGMGRKRPFIRRRQKMGNKHNRKRRSEIN